MIFDLPRLASRHGLSAPRGVILIGAHSGTEVPILQSMGCQRFLLIEPNPALLSHLQRYTREPGVTIAGCAASDTNGTANLHIMSNDQCSSLLALKEHAELYPDILHTSDLAVRTCALDSLLQELSLPASDFNWLLMDIQGAELMALRGAETLLQHIDTIISEVNFRELYEHSALAHEMDEYLAARDFQRVALSTPYHPSWGDALYVRSGVLTMQSLGRNGRFANQLLQYAFLKCAARTYGCRVQTPQWVGQQLFALSDPPVTTSLPVCHESELRPPLRNMDLFGFFQHAHLFAEHKDYFRCLFTPSDPVLSVVSPLLDSLRARGNTIVGLHLRRGDYGGGYFFIPPNAWYLDWLNSIWHTLDNPVLFIASDEPDKVLGDFSEYHPVTSSQLGAGYPCAEFYPDFFLLTQCDLLAISNSSFSFTAAMLNQRATVFVRPHLPTAMLVPFAPWNDPVLLRDEPTTHSHTANGS